MTGWVLLLAACLLTGGAAFSMVRGGFATFRAPVLAEPPAPAPRPASATEAALLTEKPPLPRAARRSVPPALRPRPRPTAPQPEDRQLALWASQIEAGTRKMTVATDGCRVTWNRTCKHDHPSWLVFLKYLSLESRGR
jgi:hypothetical protein